LHKSTSDSFYQTIHSLFNYEDKGISSSLISEDVYSIVSQNKVNWYELQDRIEAEIKHERDYTYDFFGFKTLEKSYLLRMHGRVVERPQYMLMRVSIGIHKNDLDSVFETYHLMS
jgi:ribonucleotide reductase alpha subunit